MPKTSATKRAPLGTVVSGQKSRGSNRQARIKKKKGSTSKPKFGVSVRKPSGRVIGLGGSKHAKHIPVKK